AAEIYIFDGEGRHQRTLDGFTGAVRMQFTHDGSHRLTAITDAHGNVTTIERDGTGIPTGIIAPGRQRASLTVNAVGYLSDASNPTGETVQLPYNAGTADGLLATLTDRRGQLHRFTYDADGRLTGDENVAASAVTTLGWVENTDDRFTVTRTSPLGRATSFQVDRLTTGNEQQIVTMPDGTKNQSLRETNGTDTATFRSGVVYKRQPGPDPRFGLQAPIAASQTFTTPGGLTWSATGSRTATLTSPNNLFSLSTQTDTLVVNGRTY